MLNLLLQITALFIIGATLYGIGLLFITEKGEYKSTPLMMLTMWGAVCVEVLIISLLTK